MTRVLLLKLGVVLLSSCLLLSACNHENTPSPPQSSEIGVAIAELYRRLGISGEISKQEVLGKHFKPGLQSWDVIACVDFILPSGDNGRECNDSFELYQLDSGKWIVTGTISGNYRWLEVLKSEKI